MKRHGIDEWVSIAADRNRMRLSTREEAEKHIDEKLKPSTQKPEITLEQALVVGREGFVDCPFCPARLHCDETKTVNCADVVRDCFKIVTREMERLQTVPDIDKCPSCVGMRETVERYKNMAKMAIDNLIGE